MKKLTKIKAHQLTLQLKYKQLMEQSYNLRQTDSAESDISEYAAIKLLHKLNKLKFLSRDYPSSNVVS
ncbi:Lacal_2735 family protein [Lacinutrix undariae]